MPSTLDSCEKYFKTRDIYKIFDVTKDSLEKDIKKAYYRLSLKIHPDRVPEAEKEISTEKFKILATLYQVLTDKNKKALYDEQGIIDDDETEEGCNSLLELWRKMFKPITIEDIDNFKNNFIGSEMERTEIKKSYLDGKGCINYMMNCVPFMSVEDEPRIIEIVKEMIKAGEIPEYKIFTNEPKSKRDRRHKKYAKEKVEAEKIIKNMNKKNEKSLEQQIMERNQSRASYSDQFFDKLLEKYGDDDDSDDVFKTLKSKKNAKKKTKATATATTKKNSKPKERRVKSGRVSKKKQ